MRNVDGPSARPGRLGTRGFGPGFPGRGGLAMGLFIGAGLVGMRLGIRRLDISGLGLGRLGLRRMGVGRLGLGRLGLRRMGVGGFGVRGPGFSTLGVGRLDLRRPGSGGPGLSGLGSGFRGGLSLPVAGGFFLARLLQRDLLLDGLFLAHRFLIRPFLAGRLAIGGPRRGGPVQP